MGIVPGRRAVLLVQPDSTRKQRFHVRLIGGIGVPAQYPNHGQGEALTTHLDKALKALADEDFDGARGWLGKFLSQVSAFTKVGVLTAEQGDALRAEAQAILDRIAE